MKLFSFLLIAFASFAMATRPQTLRRKALELAQDEQLRELGGEEEQVTINREYTEDGQPPAGRQVQVSPEHPAEEPEGGETLKSPAEDEAEEGHRDLYYNCYKYCWWTKHYGWITKCCPKWGCGYYFC